VHAVLPEQPASVPSWGPGGVAPRSPMCGRPGWSSPRVTSARLFANASASRSGTPSGFSASAAAAAESGADDGGERERESRRRRKEKKRERRKHGGQASRREHAISVPSEPPPPPRGGESPEVAERDDGSGEGQPPPPTPGTSARKKSSGAPRLNLGAELSEYSEAEGGSDVGGSYSDSDTGAASSSDEEEHRGMFGVAVGIGPGGFPSVGLCRLNQVDP
jgi:hypothetical protein